MSNELKVENITMLNKYNAKNSPKGTLCITKNHLTFLSEIKRDIWISYMQINMIEKLPLTTTGSPLCIRSKIFLSVVFYFPREKDAHEFFVRLQQYSRPASIRDLYCFERTSNPENIPQNAGWKYFDLQAEFQRMSVPNKNWSLTSINKYYEICDTYPSTLYVPANTTPIILSESAKFRSRGRFPVLSYLHKNKAAICRCSQPLSGFSARCPEDEKLLNCILKTNNDETSTFMYVVDTRPPINAFANRATGKGYENENFYENIKFRFAGIANIHIMRSSLNKVIETCESKGQTMSSFLSGLESSGWLKHIKSVIDASAFIANAIDGGNNVLVHCSDGWDRTAQVCSLASLLLDPYYRTVHGYEALIEKDWLSFGHKFTDRVGHIVGDPKEISPIFTQFIDATWQLTRQFPLAFEFNEKFLLIIHEHVSSCEYGTFIGNSEKERLQLELSEKTLSLWGYMAYYVNDFLNPYYQENKYNDILRPNTIAQSLRFWRGMYCRFDEGIQPRENVTDILLEMRENCNKLSSCIKKLNKNRVVI